jgi:hypothetical protein
MRRRSPRDLLRSQYPLVTNFNIEEDHSTVTTVRLKALCGGNWRPRYRRQMNLRLSGWSLLIAAGLVMLVGAIATIPGWADVGVVLFPGMLLAAVMFPEGIHSDGPLAYLFLAGVFDVLLFALLVMLCWSRVGRFRQRKSESL